MDEPDNDPVRSARWKFLALMTLFLAPVVIATAWYFLADYVTPAADPAGELIVPAMPLEAFQGERLDGSEADEESLKGRWTLIHVIDTPCAPSCRERIYYTRQIRQALGHERLRVQRLAVVADRANVVGMTSLLPEHPDLAVLVEAQGLIDQLPDDRGPATVLLVDPLGNLMMRFDAGVEPAEILDDLDQLLSVSRIG